MFCHFVSQPKSLAERIMSSKETIESAERVSVEAELHFERPTSGCNMGPRCSTYTHMHMYTSATNPVASPHCRKMKKPQLC